VKDAKSALSRRNKIVEDTLQNGVKHAQHRKIHFAYLVEDAVQNGDKEK